VFIEHENSLTYFEIAKLKLRDLRSKISLWYLHKPKGLLDGALCNLGLFSLIISYDKKLSFNLNHVFLCKTETSSGRQHMD